MFTFGSGRLFLQQGRAGNFARLGVAALQDGSMDFSTEIKSLYGANRYPVAVAQGKGKIAITAKYADWKIDTLALLLNHVRATGGRQIQVNEIGVIPHASTFTVTVAPPNSGTWTRDVQVIFLDTQGSGNTGTATWAPGYLFKQVATSPNPGEYSVATGVYTFNTADKDCRVRISYVYTVTTGFQLNDGTLNQWSNIAMGQSAACRGIFEGIYAGQQVLVELEYVVPGGWKSATKLDDFTMQDTNLEAFADPDTDMVGQISLPL